MLDLNTALSYSSRYSFILSKQTNLFCCTHRHTFHFIAATSTDMLRPCIESSIRSSYWKNQRRTQAGAIKEHLRNSWLMVFLFQTKKQLNSIISSNTIIRNLPRDSQQTLVWKIKVLYSPPVSLQRNLNSIQLQIHVLIKLTIFTTFSKKRYQWVWHPLNDQYMAVRNAVATGAHFC